MINGLFVFTCVWQNVNIHIAHPPVSAWIGTVLAKAGLLADSNYIATGGAPQFPPMKSGFQKKVIRLKWTCWFGVDSEISYISQLHFAPFYRLAN